MALKSIQMYFGMGSGESLQDLKPGHSVTGSVFGKVRSLQLQGGRARQWKPGSQPGIAIIWESTVLIQVTMTKERGQRWREAGYLSHRH